MKKFLTTFSKDHLHQDVVRKIIKKSGLVKETIINRLLSVVDELLSNAIKYGLSEKDHGNLSLYCYKFGVIGVIEDTAHKIDRFEYKKILDTYRFHTPSLEDTGKRGLSMFVKNGADIVTFHYYKNKFRVCFTILY